MKRIISLFSNLLICVLNTAAQYPGTLDTSFANNGILINENTGTCNAIGLQKSGKRITVSVIVSTTRFIRIARYNDDGSLDNTFNDSGVVYTEFTGYPGISSMHIFDDDKILIGGVYSNPGRVQVFLTRYLPDGKLDSSFGENGIVITDWGANAYYAQVAVQSDGKIVAAGNYSTSDNDFDRTYLVRYLPDGSVDEGFGDNGIIITNYPTILKVAAIVVQPDDKILVGSSGDYVTGDAYFQAARYLPDGNLDNGFGKKGIAKGNFPAYGCNLYAMALQKDDEIITAGTATSSRVSGFGLIRFQTDGTVDKSFGDNGLVITPFDSSGSSVRTISRQEDGKIVAAGYRLDIYVTYFDFAFARYQTDGSLDSSFGVNGQQFTYAGGLYSAYSSIIQKDGKIVLGGGNGPDFVLMRYFGGDGVLPVKYTSISAVQNKNTVVLTWQTTGENSNNFFTVEHAANEYDFSQIARVTAQSNNNLAQQYSYTDKAPIQGNNFYRIKQTDAKGNYNYSKTVAVNFSGKDYIQLYPNPAKDLLTVKGLRNNEMNKLFLYDLQGKLMQQFTTQSEVYSFSVSNIAAGTYMLQVQNSNGVSSHRFVKK